MQAAVLFRVLGQRVYHGPSQTEAGEDDGLNTAGVKPVRADYRVQTACLGLPGQLGGKLKAQAETVIKQEEPRRGPGQGVGEQNAAPAGQPAEETAGNSSSSPA